MKRTFIQRFLYKDFYFLHFGSLSQSDENKSWQTFDDAIKAGNFVKCVTEVKNKLQAFIRRKITGKRKHTFNAKSNQIHGILTRNLQLFNYETDRNVVPKKI